MLNQIFIFRLNICFQFPSDVAEMYAVQYVLLKQEYNKEVKELFL